MLLYKIYYCYYKLGEIDMFLCMYSIYVCRYIAISDRNIVERLGKEMYIQLIEND